MCYALASLAEPDWRAFIDACVWSLQLVESRVGGSGGGLRGSHSLHAEVSEDFPNNFCLDVRSFRRGVGCMVWEQIA